MKMFPIQPGRKGCKPHPTSIPWEVADLAYSVYSASYGRDQSLERLAERHGFGPEEMDEFLPDWRERCDSIHEVIEALRMTLLWAESMYGRLVNAGGLKDHDPINWTVIEKARKVLKHHGEAK